LRFKNNSERITLEKTKSTEHAFSVIFILIKEFWFIAISDFDSNSSIHLWSFAILGLAHIGEFFPGLNCDQVWPYVFGGHMVHNSCWSEISMNFALSVFEKGAVILYSITYRSYFV
jgi:hypothetical protein